MVEANAFLPEHMADHNRRFAVPPQTPATPTARCSTTPLLSTSS